MNQRRIAATWGPIFVILGGVLIVTCALISRDDRLVAQVAAMVLWPTFGIAGILLSLYGLFICLCIIDPVRRWVDDQYIQQELQEYQRHA